MSTYASYPWNVLKRDGHPNREVIKLVDQIDQWLRIGYQMPVSDVRERFPELQIDWEKQAQEEEKRRFARNYRKQLEASEKEYQERWEHQSDYPTGRDAIAYSLAAFASDFIKGRFRRDRASSFPEYGDPINLEIWTFPNDEILDRFVKLLNSFLYRMMTEDIGAYIGEVEGRIPYELRDKVERLDSELSYLCYGIFRYEKLSYRSSDPWEAVIDSPPSDSTLDFFWKLVYEGAYFEPHWGKTHREMVKELQITGNLPKPPTWKNLCLHAPEYIRTSYRVMLMDWLVQLGKLLHEEPLLV